MEMQQVYTIKKHSMHEDQHESRFLSLSLFLSVCLSLSLSLFVDLKEKGREMDKVLHWPKFPCFPSSKGRERERTPF